APGAAPDPAARGRRPGGRPAPLRGGPRRVHGRSLLHAPERLSVAHPAGEPGRAPRGSDRPRRRHVRGLRSLRRGRPRPSALPLLLGGEGEAAPPPVEAVGGPRAQGRYPAARRHRGVSGRPLLSLRIPAVGGQGGGVLLEWIVDAATVDGYPVHG